MPKNEYESLQEEDKAWSKLQRPVLVAATFFICVAILSCMIVSLNIVFPADNAKRPFCGYNRLQPLPMNDKSDGGAGDSDLYPDRSRTADFYWMFVFVPTTIFFFALLSILWRIRIYVYN